MVTSLTTDKIIAQRNAQSPFIRINVDNGPARDDLLWGLLSSQRYRKPVFIGDYESLWERLITNPEREFKVSQSLSGCWCGVGSTHNSCSCSHNTTGHERSDNEESGNVNHSVFSHLRFDPVTGIFIEHLSVDSAYQKLQRFDVSNAGALLDLRHVLIVVDEDTITQAELETYQQLKALVNVEGSNRLLVSISHGVDIPDNDSDTLVVNGQTGQVRGHDDTVICPAGGSVNNDDRDDDERPGLGEQIKDAFSNRDERG